MKFTTALLSAVAVAVSVSSLPLRRRDVNAALIPEFGIQAGDRPTGTGDCRGVNDILIPCSCPPDRADFISQLNANVAAGHAINNPGVALSFPQDASKASALTRFNAATVTLQNLRGPGVGCPQAATTWGAQVAAIQSGPDPVANFPGSAPAPAPAPPAPAAPAAAPAAGGVDPALVPDFGVVRGTAPTGTGDCKGLNGILIPCACPPDRADFINKLNANVAAGHAVNNPSVAVSFPTGNSKGEQQARIGALLVTLQNLNGPGSGCPAVSTVYAQLQQQINALP
ncbi:hypothetical protein C8Q80DRAFT_1100475 [Daedaleopsis nitida]|nr:hypothetical protein C8Q80DRAFT_1100475 [Daedaleopsis nitida]